MDLYIGEILKFEFVTKFIFWTLTLWAVCSDVIEPYKPWKPYLHGDDLSLSCLPLGPLTLPGELIVTPWAVRRQPPGGDFTLTTATFSEFLRKPIINF